MRHSLQIKDSGLGLRHLLIERYRAGGSGDRGRVFALHFVARSGAEGDVRERAAIPGRRERGRLPRLLRALEPAKGVFGALLAKVLKRHERACVDEARRVEVVLSSGLLCEQQGARLEGSNGALVKADELSALHLCENALNQEKRVVGAAEPSERV